jgi:hypothetical protein
VNGTVVEVNPAFGHLTGWGPEGVPYAPPYPWWPDGEVSFHDMLDETGVPLRHRDGRTIWVCVELAEVPATGVPMGGVTLAEVPLTDGAPPVTVGTLREITRERDYRDRCTSATKLGAALADHLSLQEVQAAILHGFAEVFDGTVVIAQSPTPPAPEAGHGVGERGGQWVADEWPPETVITQEGTVKWAELPDEIREAFASAVDGLKEAGRAGRPGPGLLVAASDDADLRVWVHFPVPRVVSADEHVLAATLADMMTAVIRRAQAQDDARTEAHLRAAIDSHRFVGQAVGILMERHRMTATGAFARIKEVSRNRNLKLRDVADHIITTGEEFA